VSVTEITTGVWRAGTRWVNWYLVDAGSEGCVVVDAGLPAYHRGLGRSLAAMGRKPGDVRAVVLTHGHIDHAGMAPYLADAGAPVLLHPDDAYLAAHPRANRTEKSALPYLRYPATLGFVAHAVSHGALRPDRPMPATVPLTEGPQPNVPGSPVVTHTPGHTDGSCVVEFPAHGVVFVGDLLCTASPVTGASVPPQLQTRGSNRDSAQALASLDRLADVRAPVVLPGHGGSWNEGIEAAVASARRTGCR
jgi:glyoxylase-like metal-dependent hydrolase (beta-lactamase superfamily II)